MTLDNVKRLMVMHNISLRELKQHPRLPVAPSTVESWISGKRNRTVPDAFARFMQEMAFARVIQEMADGRKDATG